MRVIAACLLLGVFGLGMADPLLGQSVGPATLTTRAGQPAEWKPGKVTVLSFFAFWCNTWKQQCPRLKAARQEVGGLPIEFLTVSVDGRWANVPGFDPSLPCLLDRLKWAYSLGVDRVPTTLVIDAEGRIRWVKSGVARTADLVEEAKRALVAPSGGEVILRFADYPKGDWELLDTLRRLRVTESSDSRQGERLVNPFDDVRPGKKELIRRVIEQASAGSTVLLHADVMETRQSLADLVEALRLAGFEPRFQLVPW